MKPILEIQNISKTFRIQNEKQSYLNLRDSISNLFKPKSHSNSEEFYALKDVSFNVMPGESIGIIGKNGAGKSTLLKILSKITPPSSGKIISRGRIASLLEVGTGFHGELSGRENIFLNGSILGMKKVEIQKNFDAIIDFSGVEKFLDTPLKHYSSGMQLRLAFAVAAFLEPEILIIDEVLAVGDTIFQRKCIEKMISISQQGNTILFVSHNLSALKSLCNVGILLESGKVLLQKDNIDNIIEKYARSGNDIFTSNTIDLASLTRSNKNPEIIFDTLNFKNNPINFGEPFIFSLKLKNLTNKKYNAIELGITINDKFQSCIIHLGNRFINEILNHEVDSQIYTFEVDNILKPGTYSFSLFLRTEEKIQDWLENIATIEINDGNPYGYLNTNHIQGVIIPDFKITHNDI